MDDGDLVALAATVLLAVAHLIPPRLRFVALVPRSWVLSAAGGVSIAYVFVHLLPEIAEAQEAVEDATTVLGSFERHAYVFALIGLTVFYGLERKAVTSRQQAEDPDEDATSAGTFWVSVTSFAVYNAIIGYLVVRRAEDGSVVEMALFAVALAVHFVVNDLGLRDHHQHRYDRFGRPLLIAAIFAGYGIGLVLELSEAAVGLAIALLAGGVVLNVVKEELPSERDSRFLPLLVGATVYTALLLAV